MEAELPVRVASTSRGRRSFTVPLTRYAARLFTRHRQEEGEEEQQRQRQQPRSEDEESGHDYSYYNDNGSYCYYGYYWKAIMVVDLVWNLGFVVVALVVLLSTFKERPSTPLRLWLFGYSLQCLFHVACVYLHFLFRNSSYTFSHNRIVKSLESINTMISSIWWVFGFYWIVAGGQALLQDSPRLYWLTVVFLAFDLFFIIFCIGMAFVIFVALCCCIPLVAFAYAMTIRKGASEDDIGSLPKYRFRQANPMGIFDNDGMKVVGAMESGNSNSVNELSLQPEDSECCICLSQYVDGVELYTLPCNHHFHCGCISRWLRINATCPLCKYNILRGDTLV